MGVDLRRAETGVAEEALDVADVDAGLDQLGCGGMAQHVRGYMGLEARGSGGLGEAGSHRRRGERFIVQVEEQARMGEAERGAGFE